MMRKPRDAGDSFSLGRLYRQIPGEDLSEGDLERKLFKKPVPFFVRFCRNIYKMIPSLGRGAKFEKKFAEAISFLGWDLKAEELSAASKIVLLGSVVLGFVFVLVAVFSPLRDIFSGIFGPFGLIMSGGFAVIIVLMVSSFFQNYPLGIAEKEKTRALTYVPEIMGYMIMSMKLVPNLEKAVEFAAGHGKGKIADDFRDAIWNVQIGVFSSLSEALDDLALRWGKFSEEFKRSMMMVRASVLEGSEDKRFQVLDKTMDTILDSVRVKMERYARDLQQPATILFYLGVILPLILVIILPVGSAFTGQAFARPEILAFIYNLALPALTIVFAFKVINSRPPTYEPPVIPDDFPSLPPKGKMKIGGSFFDIRLVVATIFLIGLLGSVFLSAQGIPPKSMISLDDVQLLKADKNREELLKEKTNYENYFSEGGPLYLQKLAQGVAPEVAMEQVRLEELKFYLSPENDVTPYNLFFGLIITIGLCFFIFFHFSSIYKFEAQQKIMLMESEFKDSLYILASRLGENKPMEEALRHTKEFLPELTISNRVFGRTMDNINLLGMPLEAAVFDKTYGAMRNLPSKTIGSGMKLIVDAVQLGVNVAARTLISFSLQLSNMEKVNRLLKDMINDTTSSMNTMVTFVMPIVLGITTALQRIVLNTLAGVASSGTIQDAGSQSSLGGTPLAGFSGISTQFASPDVLPSLATPLQFLFIISLYVLEITVIITYFNTKIQEDNDLATRLAIAKSVPIALSVFILAVIVSNIVVGGTLAS